MNKTFTKTLEISKTELKKWNNLLKRDDIDYDKEGFGKYTTVWRRTVKFDDGCEIEIDVCSGAPEDHGLWCEAVLFDSLGWQLDMTVACWDLGGEWNLSFIDKDGKTTNYKVIIREI